MPMSFLMLVFGLSFSILESRNPLLQQKNGQQMKNSGIDLVTEQNRRNQIEVKKRRGVLRAKRRDGTEVVTKKRLPLNLLGHRKAL